MEAFVAVVIVSLVFALIGGLIAPVQKQVQGFLLGLFLGPLGLILAAILYRSSPAPVAVHHCQCAHKH